jgi:hypothetical protein
MIHPATDLNFAGQKGAYATHAMHSFSAKFPPQLPRWAIQEFTKKGDAAIIISEWFAKWREKRGKRKGLGTLGLNLVIPDFPNRDY